MHVHVYMGLTLQCNLFVYTDQLQGESSVTAFQPSTKKQLVERAEGNLSIEASENSKSKFTYTYVCGYLPKT